MKIALLLATLLLPATLRAADSAYRAEVKKWRENYEKELTSEDGWLSVSGLFWLREGDNRFGASPLNDIVLPSGPAEAGVFEFRAGKTTVELNSGVTAEMNGKPVQTAELVPDAKDARLHMGRLTLFVHASGSRYAIRLKDKDSALRRDFKGLHWFPIDEKWHVVGHYTPYLQPKTVEVQNVMGDVAPSKVPGAVDFTLEGKLYRLEPELEDDGTFEFVFRDLTSGEETYPSARFLDTPAPAKDGTVILDFNEAYNPPCAYNRFTTCPLPTPGNRLPVRVTAGEKVYQKH